MSLLNISLFQIIVILVSARAVGLVFRRIGQPQVVGEMVAGLILGPTLMGRYAPGFFAFCFPEDSMDTLFILSRLGIWLFIFLVGTELDLDRVRRVGQAVLIISQTSIIVPLIFGCAFSFLLYSGFSGHGTPFISFMLFMGVAMSITAFPVLARILREKGLERSDLGAMATACAAVNDITAWCLLAGAVIAVHADKGLAVTVLRFGGLIAYVLFMWLVARPLLRRSTREVSRLEPGLFSLLLLILFVSCVVTQTIGIHALFGAFFFGVVLPKEPWLVEGIMHRIEPITTALFLPIFFAFTGIRTDMGLMNTGRLWALGGAVVGVAVAGKFLGTAIPARLLGQSWSAASALGALMNTRGLMELVILNIGLDLGVISPVLFSMMVMMAIVTTFMTSPWLALCISGNAKDSFAG